MRFIATIKFDAESEEAATAILQTNIENVEVIELEDVDDVGEDEDDDEEEIGKGA